MRAQWRKRERCAPPAARPTRRARTARHDGRPRGLKAPFGALVAAFLCALIAAPFSPANAEVRAFLDREQVYEGDQVRLTIEADGAGASGEPELGPLREDFLVGGTGTSRQTRIVNGRRSDRTSWQVVLEPKRIGELTIPAIGVGDERTDPLALKVEPLPAEGIGAPGDEVWLEVKVEADADDLVVQQQVPLIVRAYSARALLDYAIEIPPVEGALLTRIGRDRGEITTRAGRQYRVIERRFMLNPQRSGELRIPPITFDAELKTEPGARGGGRQAVPDLFNDPMIERMFGGVGGPPGFSMFERGEPARARSGALTFEVASAPASFGGRHWLPASDLEIEDSWNPGDGGEMPSLTVGEPATRTLTLIAKGLAGNQIPEIEMPVPDGFRAYPEKTEATTRSDGESMIGVSRQRVTLIPTSAGDRVLPRIEVRWWDTDEDAERAAVVPKLRVHVAGSAGSASDAMSGGAIADGAGAQTGLAPSAASGPSPAEGEEGPDGERAQGGLTAGIAVGLAVALLLVLVSWFWWRSRGAVGSRAAFRRSGGSAATDPGATEVGLAEVGLLGAELPEAGLSDSADPGAGVARAGAGRSGVRALGSSLLGLRVGLRGRNRAGNQGNDADPMRDAIEALRAACERDDARAAAGALLRFGAARWPKDPPISLRALAARAAPSQRPAIEALERALYGAAGGESAWRGEGLWEAVRNGIGSGSDAGSSETGRPDADRGAEPLAPLYPHRT